MRYSQILAIFIKSQGLDFEFLDEALQGKRLPRHLTFLYEEEGVAIRNLLFEEGRLQEVVSFAQETLGLDISEFI